jgi:AcrR family transcriptional regulator
MSTSDSPLGSPKVPQSGRPRDATASKEALLQAAQVLFSKQGFDGTTIREIGEQAGVDASLIARYFGSKADLYIAALAAENAAGIPSKYDGRLEQMAEVVLARADRVGPGPVLQAVVRSDTSPEIRDAALDLLARRMVSPLVANMSAEGVDRPQLRAEVAVSALLGISLARALGWFEEIRSVPREELVDLIADGLESITESRHAS